MCDSGANSSFFTGGVFDASHLQWNRVMDNFQVNVRK